MATAGELQRKGSNERGTNAIQVEGYGALSVQDGGLSVQGDDAAEDPHRLGGKGFEVLRGDAGGRFRCHGNAVISNRL